MLPLHNLGENRLWRSGDDKTKIPNRRFVSHIGFRQICVCEASAFPSTRKNKKRRKRTHVHLRPSPDETPPRFLQIPPPIKFRHFCAIIAIHHLHPFPKWGSGVLTACTRISNSTVHLHLTPSPSPESHSQLFTSSPSPPRQSRPLTTSITINRTTLTLPVVSGTFCSPMNIFRSP